MKAKISLGGGGIRGLILKHVEKAVIALAVLIFVFLVWGASKLGGDFDLQPDQLKNTSVEADKAIREPKKGPPSEVPPWLPIAQGIKKPVPADPYGVENTWMHRLFPRETLRGEPAVFPLEKLRASTGFGGISISASGALTGTAGPGEMPGYGMDSGMEAGGSGLGGNTEGRRWVVITGLLPYKKQWNEYGDMFRNAEVKLPQRDVPAYVYYEVERARVTPGVEPKEDEWQELKILTQYKERKWAGSQPEIIHPKFLHRSASIIPMAYPLPPVVSKTFGPEIAHEPEIPLYYEVERVVKEEEVDLDSLTPEELIEYQKKHGRIGAGGGASGMSGYDEYGGGYEQDYGGMDMGSGGYGDMAGYGEMGSGGGYGGVSTMGRQREIPKYQLFRFFDFSVRPGQYYQYRVRLRLTNPNYELPPQNLEDEKLAEKATLQTDWSEPTKVVNVPLDSRVLAGPVSVSANVNVTPKGELATVHFNDDTGEEVAEKYTVARGQLMNYLGVEVKEEKPKSGMYGGYGDEYGMSPDMTEDPYGAYGGAPKKKERRKKEPKEEPKTVDYITEMLVLDFLGGSTLPGTDRNLKEPGRILLMDSAGNLLLHEELEDQEQFVGFFPPEVKKKEEPENPYGDEYGSYMVDE